MRLVKQSLEISAIEVEDGGDYICNVETVGRPLDQVHTLTVLVPPVIKRERGVRRARSLNYYDLRYPKPVYSPRFRSKFSKSREKIR